MAKTWVIPDIHGCANTLQLLMEDHIKPNKNDHLIFLGDYIDRGPDSKRVIDLIMEMEDRGYRITALKGNHEDSCIKARDEDGKRKGFLGYRTKSRLQKEWEAYGGKETLESFGAVWAHEIPEKYINWLKSLKYYIELDQFIAVHAGLNFKIDDPFSDTRAMMWIREYEIIPEKIKNKRIIHGHVPVNLEFIDLSIKSDGYRFIDLDNGIYMTQKAGHGNLVALELTSMEYKIQSLADEIDYAGRI